MKLTRFLVNLAILILAASSVNADIVVSVLPFECSAGDDRNKYLNRSIAEMIVVDLAGVTGITIVERADIEKLLKEQALSLTGAVDEVSASAVGKLLGAQYLVTGSYTVKSRRITVGYKVIEVESGVVRQAGSVRERLRKFLVLKNSLVAGIFSSLRTIAGIGTFQPAPGDSKLSIDDAVEFGKALDYRDRGDFENAKTVLRGFTERGVKLTYAQRTLDALEKRLLTYDDRHRDAIDRMAGSQLTYSSFIKMVTGYMGGAEYSKVIALCRRAKSDPPPVPNDTTVKFGELCDYYCINSFYQLDNWDSTIATGEQFLKNYPGSIYFKGIEQMVNSAITTSEQKQNSAGPSTELIGMIKEAAIVSGADAALLNFKIAGEWFNLKQWTNALDWFRKIDPAHLPEAIQPDLVAYQVFMCYYNLKSRADALAVFDTAKQNYPKSQFIGAMRQLVGMIPE